ncbi:MAG: MBL fold metallo-hydrolase [Chloroflexota bacterium]|nr:MBL fold metallo-hydrolase [Chloroflexota bacterium]MDQ5866537.1 MBL fold metallo-hydrolase [Chloroflexota bacterium]
MNIVNVGYDSTNYYVIADTLPRLLVDVGWPGTLPKLRHACERMGVSLPEVKHLLVTHYHPDHAGLVQELKRTGTKLIVADIQVAAIPLLRTYMKPQHNYVDIDPSGNIVLVLEESRAFLASVGIRGEIISTPGHSDDSITLVLDDGAAFTGDPTPLMAAPDNEESVIRESWEKIRALGAKTIYPGHGPVGYI